MTTQRSYDSIRNDLVARAQDCIHYFAALLSPERTGFESTFIDRIRGLKGKLDIYEDAHKAFVDCISLALDLLPTLETLSPEAHKVAAKAIETADKVHVRLVDPEYVSTSTELNTMAYRGFVAFENLMEKLHIHAPEAIDLDDLESEETKEYLARLAENEKREEARMKARGEKLQARVVDEYSKKNL